MAQLIDGRIHPERVRHELKYIIPVQLSSDLRNYIQFFCCPDPYSNGKPPVYNVSTLQLDSPSLALHLAKERKQVNRFKLRIRSYSSDPDSWIYFEVKRKEEHFIRKTRSRIQLRDYDVSLFQKPFTVPDFQFEHGYVNQYEFLRLKDSVGAQPMMHIHYERESWIGKDNPEIRITMDRKIRYHTADGYALLTGDEKGWRAMDGETALRRPFGGLVLEIKTSMQIPSWILKLIQYFDLQRTGFCKYSAAMRLESLYTGQTYTAMYERCHL